MHSFLAKRTFWTRMADMLYTIGKVGPIWFRVLAQADGVMWALKHTRRQWYNGKYWTDRI